MMANYERQSLLEYCIDGAIIEMHSSNDEDIQKWCVLDRVEYRLRTESHAQPLLTVGDHGNGTIVHHQEWKT